MYLRVPQRVARVKPTYVQCRVQIQYNAIMPMYRALTLANAVIMRHNIKNQVK